MFLFSCNASFEMRPLHTLLACRCRHRSNHNVRNYNSNGNGEGRLVVDGRGKLIVVIWLGHLIVVVWQLSHRHGAR